MDFITPPVELIVSWLLNPLMKHIKYLVKARTNMQNMADKLQELGDCRSDLQKEMGAAERQQKEGTTQVESWLKKVEEVGVQVEAINNKYENRGCRFLGGRSLNCWLAYKYSKNAAKLVDEMDQLKIERDAFHAIATEKPPAQGQAMRTESTVLALNRYVEMVLRHLVDDTVGVIGIHGMGGVGKTTLLKLVNNSLLEENRLGFDYLISVVVSKEPQLKEVQRQVTKSLMLKLNDEDDTNANANIIFNYLKKKNFLLLLDDVWKEIDLGAIGIPDTHCSTTSSNQPKRLQKVILTTRFQEVCGHMRADKIIKVECLNKTDAMILFKRTMGESFLESNSIRNDLVEEVVNECAGLPLALVVIARAMATKTTIQEWRNALETLKKSQGNKIMGEDLYYRLKLSYDSLPNDELRRCFLYCSMWPEDYEYNYQELILFYISVGIIKDYNSMSVAYDKGRCLIEDLKRACLLEGVPEDIFKNKLLPALKMHDVMRDVALYIASDCGANQNKWLVQSGIGLREAPLEAEKWKDADVVSLMNNDIEELPSLPFECPTLTVLILKGNNYLSRIHPGFFQSMCALTCLDLSNTSIKELPKSITMLTRLRCLNLEGTGHLKYIPSGMLSSLPKLQVLHLNDSAVCRNLDGVDNLMEELECLPGGLKLLLGIEVCYSPNVLRRLSMFSRAFIWRLRIIELKDFKSANQLNYNMWGGLLRLEVLGCSDAEVLEFVVDDKKNDYYCPIETLEILRCRLKEILLKGVAPSRFFQNLNLLTIAGCNRMKSISWILLLPSLSVLYLDSCSELECLVEEEGEDNRTADAFPALKYLRLLHLPKLRRICGPQYCLPALERVKVTWCPMLKKFPFPSNKNVSKLASIKCDKEWWEGLEWDDMSIKSSMESILVVS